MGAFDDNFRASAVPFFAIAAILFGMVFSPVVLSLGTILLVWALLTDTGLHLSHHWKSGLTNTLKRPLTWGLAGLYLVMVFNIGLTEDWGYLLERLRIKLPLLLLPIAWAAPLLRRRADDLAQTGRLVLCGFLALVLLGILINYGLHFERFNELIRVGQSLPVPRGNHVRFSLLVAIAGVACVDGWFRYRNRWLLSLGVVLFVGLHVLAVRSGLATAYVGQALLATWWAAKRGSWRMLCGVMAGLILLPVLAYATVPTFRTKLQYMRYELLHRDASVDTAEYSDTERLTSIRYGLQLWREHPVIGVGYGNLEREMKKKYFANSPGKGSKRPHNQFVSALASGGVIGFLVTVACFLAIGFGGGRWRDPLFVAVWAMLLASCLVENTLETSVGVTLFTLSLLLFAYPPCRKPG